MLCFVIGLEEAGSSEESGKDWSDLEAEAAEADKNQKYFEDEYTTKRGGGGGGSKPSSSSYRGHGGHSSSSSKKHKRY